MVPSPNQGVYDSYMDAVSCVSAAACMAVGHYIGGSGALRTLAESWDGARWSVVPTPNRGRGGNALLAASCVLEGACMAVGGFGFPSGGASGLSGSGQGTLGMSKSRVSQLLSAGSRPERAFLGPGAVTVAIGGKLEAGKATPGGVVSTESFAAYEVLADLARSVGLETTCEIVPPPGLVHLNRANLIVMAGPRLLPFLGQVLEADAHLGYGHDESGWYLLDKASGQEYRSPSDSGTPGDYAYIGRLPRPDGKGTFLYLAGIHAPGNLGAACFLADNLAELHRELKTRRLAIPASAGGREPTPLMPGRGSPVGGARYSG